MLDLKTEEGRRAVDKLVATADVFVENFRPGKAAKLGLTPERLTLMLIVEQPGQVFFPMMVGGTLAGIVAWFVFFFPVRAAVSAYRARSLMRRTKKARHRKLELEV